jgi:hypothetical protein
MVARQLSVWPFGARTARLFLLVDPSLPSQTLRSGLLRAMQQGYFGSDGYSQTRAVREAALAAHYVLRHHNRDVLPLNQVNAASAVAAVRGGVAFVALAGHAAAFAWHEGELTGQRAILRLPRPLGLERDPAIALWRTPLAEPSDRLVLVCGASWPPDSEQQVRSILASTSSTAEAEQKLAQILGDAQPASVLVVAPHTRAPHLRLLPPREPEAPPSEPFTPSAHDRSAASAQPSDRPVASLRERSPGSARGRLERWGGWSLHGLGALLFGLLALAALAISPHTVLPTERVDTLSPRMAVRLGGAAANIADLAVGSAALYTLDVAEGVVRAYALNGLEQQPSPETLLARAGTWFAGAPHPMAEPVAIEYLPGAPGSLAIVDQSRTLAQLADDGSSSLRDVPSASSWQELGALGSSAAGELLFLDSRAHQLLAYPVSDQTVVDPPSIVLNSSNVPWLGFERVAQVVGQQKAVVARLDDGSVHRIGPGGLHQQLLLPPVEGRSSPISAISSDRDGGVYLADPLDARVVETTLDGTLVRQLRAPALAGVRAIDVSLDGRRLYALVATGVLVADIPAL